MTQSLDTTAPSPPPSPPPLPYATDDFTPLDPRALELARLVDLITFGVVLALGAIPFLIWARGPFSVTLIGGAWLGSLALVLWSTFHYEPRAYRAFGYRIDDRVLVIRSGVWWKTVQLLPLNRLQHADLRVGPLQRRYGLATLVVYTAGTQQSSLEIPGLAVETATALRDHLVAVGGDDGV